jgi:glycosyltransferase involved in cell wall biosynthesis
MQPLISVIMLVYNAERYLAESLESVLSQGIESLELLVVDDGSTDRSSEIIRSYGSACSCIYQTNQGVTGARNTGLRESKGALIACLDADDLYLPHKLSSQAHYLEKNPQVGIVLCPIQLTDERLNPLGNPFICYQFGSAMIRKEVFDQVGLCESDFVQSQDVDWFLRARDAGIQMAHQQQPGMLYRQHATNVSRDKTVNQHYFLLALHRSIQRRKYAST